MVSKVAEFLNEEASACSSGGDKVLETLDATIKILRSRGLKLDLDMVKTAIFAYKTRNLLCHSETDLKNAFFPGNIRPKDGRDSDASKSRRGQAASDPTSNGPSLKRMADGNLDSERVTKLARILGEAPGTSMTRGEEEFKRQSEGLLGQLDGLYRKNPSKAHRALEYCKRLVRNMGAAAHQEVPEEEPRAEREKERKSKRKAEKKNKRKAVVEGRIA
ncbi:hypothetical protein DTO164E3_1765 [Paecilomyces variotii]|nr:hypothetical protein DTO164E3_1765 [Paecilomyces variotii]KAJ9208440.1 hypothetical protein DTO032I3_417 [Paecilomyces variotii]KAJ9264173.1 hypothetical protein DTO212C5_7232 [Paecilomyces variotii]KAJ9279976.1 hypothetical protein DTO021D3_3204 [Paecilomyces variotii]KAJ9284555.1 hypothetical protein DTO021C3_7890 [Paecilomyces variotii]